MNRIRMLACALVLVLALACAAAAAPGTGFFFIHLCDPQLGFTAQNKDMNVEIDHFTKAVADINRLKPAFVIITGDYTHAVRDPKEARQFWAIAHTIRPDVPLYLAPGNHDVQNFVQPQDVKAYERIYGKDHYSFTYGGSKFIILNSPLTHPNSDKELREAQLKWFESELASTQAKKPDHIFVCSHQPWFLTSPDEPDAYQNVATASRGTYLGLMNKYGVDYALLGHLHHELAAKDGCVTLLAGLPLSLSVDKPPVVGLSIYKVYKDRVEHQSYPLDQVPAQVKM